MQTLETIWLPIAFALGLGARLVGLPPLVGFLVAGFVLHALGMETSELLEQLADVGVTLLLFTIGLKLRVSTLMRPEIWAGTSLQMTLTTLLFGAVLSLLTALGLSRFADLALGQALLLGFALSFSSTVFAVKLLDDRSEVDAAHGRTAIGILIMQDVIAVVFLALSTGKLPSPYAVCLLGLLLLRPLLYAVLDRAGHGDLLILLGFLLALGLGFACFETLGIKGDLGALVVGMLLAPHPRAKDLAHTLLGFKDLLLVGFFLSIGLRGLPDAQGLWIAAGLVLLVPVKVVIYFGMLTRFRLRARTSLLTSLALANYSEFGLIVGAIGVTGGWIDEQWLVILAIAFSISLVAAAPLNGAAHALYDRLGAFVRRFEAGSLRDGASLDLGDAEIIVVGMGRVGSGAYDAFVEGLCDAVLGIDVDADVVARNRAAGRRVLCGDAADADFWDGIVVDAREREKPVRLVLLALDEHAANVYGASQIREHAPGVPIASIAKYEEEVEELRGLGVTATCNLYAEAGAGFASKVCRDLAAAAA